MSYTAEEIADLAKPATAWRKHQFGAHESKVGMRDWLVRVSRFLDDLEQVIDDYSSVLPRAA